MYYLGMHFYIYQDFFKLIQYVRSWWRWTALVVLRIWTLFSLGILDQSAVWVDEMNYYDMRTDRNKGISPLSLRPANPLGIEIDK